MRDLNTNAVVSTENYCYDAAGNVVSAPDGCYTYDTNNRLTVFDGYAVSYDLDGNMLSNGKIYCTYDSANRLTYAGGVSYTYNAEDVRIRVFSEEEDTTYTYNTNAKLSMLLMKTTNGVVTKYVYGKGLIGEESGDTFKTYHFDCRGSTVAITDANGNVTDTFAYDTYGKLLTRTGTSNVIFGYNGRDGVVTDSNGLVYMRARYYSPDMRRFVNADIVAGKLSNAITLNRFVYANGNPVSFVDPFGLAAERGEVLDADVEKIIKVLNELFIFSAKYMECEYNFDLGGVKCYFNSKASFGNGDINISKLFEEQIGISSSINFKNVSFDRYVNNEGSIILSYSVDVDKYNSVAVALTINGDSTVSAEYQVSTEFEDDVSLTTMLGIEVDPKKGPPSPPPTVPVFTLQVVAFCTVFVAAAGAAVVAVADATEHIIQFVGKIKGLKIIPVPFGGGGGGIGTGGFPNNKPFPQLAFSVK